MRRLLHRLRCGHDPYAHGPYTLRAGRWTCWCGFVMPRQVEERIARE